MLESLKKEVLDAALNLMKYSLVTLTGGNVSARDPESGYIVVTPSGMEYEKLVPDDMVVVDIYNNKIEGEYKQSVDTPDLLYIYRHMDTVNSIIHTHSTYAQSFAILNEEIPCATTTLANEVGGSVPVAPYSPVASDGIGPSVVSVIGDKRACLLANHGVIAVGPNVKHALTAAVMLEDSAKAYLMAKAVGEPVILPDSEVEKARNVFFNIYGQKEEECEVAK